MSKAPLSDNLEVTYELFGTPWWYVAGTEAERDLLANETELYGTLGVMEVIQVKEVHLNPPGCSVDIGCY